MILIEKRPEIQKIAMQILEALQEDNDELAGIIFYALNYEHQIAVQFEIQIGLLQEMKSHPLLKF